MLKAAQEKLELSFLDVPSTVPIGETLRYVVELENASDAPVSLDPCPVYYQAWGESGTGVSRTSLRSCDDAPDEIEPGASVKFEMQLPIEDVDAIPGQIVWYLGAPGAERRADGPVEAVPSSS